MLGKIHKLEYYNWVMLRAIYLLLFRKDFSVE
jgi:hypothetical protein